MSNAVKQDRRQKKPPSLTPGKTPPRDKRAARRAEANAALFREPPSRPKRVLVTSFGSFGAVTSNPSADVIKALFQWISCEVLTHEMQVVYSEVMETVPMLWAEQKPDLVVHLGVHPDIRCVRVEQQAFSDGYCRLDADGLVPVGNKCIDNLDQTLRTSINVKRIVKKTNKLWRELEIECSDNPGRYLLGFAYYLSLCNDNSKALAIHIPPLSEKITVPLLSHIVATIIRITLHDMK